MLTIETVESTASTAWNVRDEQGELIATFDSRGGWTQADAERLVDDDKGDSCDPN